MHQKFTEQKNWSQEMKMKVNQYFHKMLESSHGVPEDLIELINNVIKLQQTELKVDKVIVSRRLVKELIDFHTPEGYCSHYDQLKKLLEG